MTALHVVSSIGHVGVTNYLLGVGANVNVTDDDGKSPLIWACQRGHLNVVKLLVKRKAKIDHRYTYGFVWNMYQICLHSNALLIVSNYSSIPLCP